jgi:uncharacterized protein (TIGR03083 family)
MTSPMTPPWPDLCRWLQDDARALARAVWSRSDAPVPTCPGWVARDVVDHVAEVYSQKIATMRLRRRPDEGEWAWAPDDDTVFAWFEERLEELVHELDTRDAAQPCWTWWEEDQTVGFWRRRMTHETAIHRVDAQLAAGLPLTPHDDRLAVDGVDEVLRLFAGDPEVLEQPGVDDGRAGHVLVTAGTRSWLVDLADGRQVVTDAPDQATAVDAVLRGAPSDVYRALWNRPTEGPVLRDGDTGVLERLDARLLIGTE